MICIRRLEIGACPSGYIREASALTHFHQKMFTQIAAALAALALLSSSADGALMPNVLLMCAGKY